MRGFRGQVYEKWIGNEREREREREREGTGSKTLVLL